VKAPLRSDVSNIIVRVVLLSVNRARLIRETRVRMRDYVRYGRGARMRNLIGNRRFASGGS